MPHEDGAIRTALPEWVVRKCNPLEARTFQTVLAREAELNCCRRRADGVGKPCFGLEGLWGGGLVSFRRRLASLGFDLGEFVKIVEPWLGRPRPEPRAWPKRVALMKCTHAKVQHAVFAGFWAPVDRSAALGTKREASKLATLGGLDEYTQLSAFDFKGAGRCGNNGAERRAGLNLAIRAVAYEHHVRVDFGFKGNKATKAFTVYMH